MTRTALCLLLLPFCTLADDAELWLVELEHNDGGCACNSRAELELGSAELHGVAQPDGLVPGMHLAIQSRYGVAETIRVLDGRRIRRSGPVGGGRRIDCSPIISRHCCCRISVRWCLMLTLAGSTAAPPICKPGRRLVLSRDEEGRLTDILIPDPEDPLDAEE